MPTTLADGTTERACYYFTPFPAISSVSAVPTNRDSEQHAYYFGGRHAERACYYFTP